MYIVFASESNRTKLEILIVVEEHLRDDILRTVFDFFLQPIDVRVEVGSLLVLFGIARHAIGEFMGAGMLLHGSVQEVALIETVDLLLQFRSMRIALLAGHESVFMFRLVPPQQ